MKPGFVDVLKIIAHDVPFFAGLVVVWAAAFALQIRLALLTRRHARRWATGPDTTAALPASRARPDRLAWMAVGAVAVYLGCVLVSTMVARSRLLHALSAPDTAARVRAVNDNLSGLLNALPFGMEAALPLMVLAAYVFATCAWMRRREGGHDASLPRFLKAALAIVGLGLIPLGLGVLGYMAMLIQTASGVAGVDPQMKALMLIKGMEEARPGLITFAVVALCGLLVTIAAIARAWLRKDSARAAATASDADHRARRMAGGVAAAALVLFAVAMSLHTENQAPWPEPSRDTALNVGAFEPSAIKGPDPVPWAPVLFVEPGRLSVGGTPASPERATAILKTLANNYMLLHPGEPFPGELGVYCPANVPAAALEAALRVAAGAGYGRLSLLWMQPGEIRRPLLGRVPRPTVTGAALPLPTPGRPGQIRITGTCGSFGAEVAKLRRQGVSVQVQVPFEVHPPSRPQFAF